MSGEKSDAGIVVGCLLALLQLMIQFPLFCAILYGIMTAVNPPVWCWVCFWIYLPVCFMVGFSRSVVEAVVEGRS